MTRSDPQVERQFSEFEGEMKEALNSAVNRGQVVSMVAQHIITKPIFEELFPDNGFIERNPVGAALDRFLETLDHGSIAAEILSLKGMYDGLKASVKNARSDKSKQDIVRGMYDTFFKAANPDFVAEKGMIYTPPDIVDFIIRSVEDILVDEFDTSLKNKGVDIIDPFTGTGVFITRLLQSGLIPLDQLEYKYKNEIHANEVVLLAYYIAAINIEFEFHRLVKSDDYMEFEGICFADTFQMYESKGKMSTLMPDNSNRRKKQIESPLRVIIGNPPYRFAKGPVYPALDADLEQTFSKLSRGTGKSAVSNAYLKAVRWASTHLSDKGVISLVVPDSFMRKPAFNGVRKSLCKEFSSIYLFDLRGDHRIQGELQKPEGDQIFTPGSQLGIVIIVLVRNPNSREACPDVPARVFSYRVEDYLKRDKKFEILRFAKGVSNMRNHDMWNETSIDAHGDWFSHRDDSLSQHRILIDDNGKNSVFALSVFGVKTGRDIWCCNYSSERLVVNIQNTVNHFNECARKFRTLGNVDEYLAHIKKNKKTEKITWDDVLQRRFKSPKHFLSFKDGGVFKGQYRPFTSKYVYVSKDLTNRRPKGMVNIFPESR